MGRRLQDDEEIPVNLWAQYDRLQRDPRLKQRMQEDLMLGTQGKVPGPGHYNLEAAGSCGLNPKSSKNGRVQISFGNSERWHKDTLPSKKKGGNAESDDENGGSYMARGKLGQKKGMRWGQEERQKLNELYWELGRAPRPSQIKSHYELYAQRHRVLYKNRPKEEVIERVKYMLKFNCFKEPGEDLYWKSKKKEVEETKTRPARTQRKPRPRPLARSSSATARSMGLSASSASSTQLSHYRPPKSPFATALSTRRQGPGGVPFSSAERTTGIPSAKSKPSADDEEQNEPPNER